jgi:polysaccharide biosynthesis transport protein
MHSPTSPDPHRPQAPNLHPQAPSQETPTPGLDLRTLIHVFVEKFWILFFILVVGLLLGVGYLKHAAVLYMSNATLQVEQEERKIIKIDRATDREDLCGLDVLQTIAQTLKSRSLLERVIETNNLAKDPRFVGLMKEQPTRERLATALAKMVDVRLRRGTRLIDVVMVHPIPEMTEKIANSLVEEFMRENVEQHTDTSVKANEFLFQEAGRLKKKLQESENALQIYREKTGAVSLDQRQDTVVARLKELSTRVTEAKSARIRWESDYA